MNDTSMPRGLTAWGPQGIREVGLSRSKSEGEQREEDWRGVRAGIQLSPKGTGTVFEVCKLASQESKCLEDMERV